MSHNTSIQLTSNNGIAINTPGYPEKLPELVKISKKKLKLSCDSLLNFLSNSPASEIFELKLGKFKLHLQLKENAFPSKSYLSSSICSFSPDQSTTEILSSSSEDLKRSQSNIVESSLKIEDYSVVFDYIISAGSIRTVNSIKNLAERAQNLLVSVETKAQKILEKTKGIDLKKDLNEEIKSIKEEVEELTAQLFLTDKTCETDLIQMEINRKNTRLTELRSISILALSENRKKLCQNAVRFGKVSEVKKNFSENQSFSDDCNFRIFRGVTKEIEEMIEVTRELRKYLFEFMNQ